VRARVEEAEAVGEAKDSEQLGRAAACLELPQLSLDADEAVADGEVSAGAQMKISERAQLGPHAPVVVHDFYTANTLATVGVGGEWRVNRKAALSGMIVSSWDAGPTESIEREESPTISRRSAGSRACFGLVFGGSIHFFGTFDPPGASPIAKR
jgi:hypothetical protein